MKKKQTKKIDELLNLMATLRNPDTGCPWDIKQTFSTIAPYTIEEAYEVADAITRNDMDGLKNELGDLLFQVIFHSRMAEESGYFDFDDVVCAVTEKMVNRHPHVFDHSIPSMTVDQQTLQWEKNKQKNKNSVLDDIPHVMPELLRAVKLTRAAAVIGFDWPNINCVMNKLQEEMVEFREAVLSENTENIKDELGDLLFVCVNLARHVKIDPGSALRHANHKFEQRFRQVEKTAKTIKPDQSDYELDFLESLWQRVKSTE